MTPHFVNYLENNDLPSLNRNLLATEYYSSGDSREYSAYEGRVVKKSYLSRLNDSVEWIETGRSLKVMIWISMSQLWAASIAST